MKKIFRRTLKVLAWTVASVVLLLVLIIVLIQIPSIQNFAKDKAVTFLQNKIGTPVRIDRLNIKFPKTIVLEGIYFEDQQKDTLLAGQKILVDVSMFKLLNSELEVNEVGLEGIRANIYRKGTDTNFNFQYIVDAFASGDKKPVDTTSGGSFKIDIKHVHLEKILATFRDDITGNDVYAYLGEFETHLEKFNLDSMEFDIPEVILKNSTARFYQHKPMVEPRTEAEVKQANTEAVHEAQSTSTPLNLTLGKLALEGIDFDFKNDVSAVEARIKFQELSAKPEKIDLATLFIKLKSLDLHGLDANIHLGATPPSKEVEEQATASVEAQAENPWKFIVDEIDLTNNHLKFDNDNSPRQPRGMDFAHLDVNGLIINASNLELTPVAYKGSVNNIAFTEQSGFVLHELKTDFIYNEKGAGLNNLYLKTDKTELRNKIGATWTSLESLATNIGDMQLVADLDDCTLAFEDVLTFVPTLATAPPFKGNEHAVVKLDAQVNGYVKNLDIKNFEVRGQQGIPNTGAKIAGTIKGLPDANKAYFNLHIAYARTTAADLNTLLPAGTLPNTIRVPEVMGIKGLFNGGMNDFKTNLQIATSRGVADVNGTIRGMGKSYNMDAAVGSLDLAYILKDPSMGKVTAKALVNGSGFDPKTMVANVKAKVISAGFNGYVYQNLDLNAQIKSGNVVAKAQMRDPNLRFDLDATALLKNEFPAIKMELQLDSVNLKDLNLYAEDLKIHGLIKADLPSTNPDALQGTVRITDLIVANNGTRYPVTDTIAIDADVNGAQRTIIINSEVINAKLDGEYKLTEIAPSVMGVINKYYSIPGYKPTAVSPQMWTLTASVLPSRLLYAFVPALKGSDSINARINFNSAASDLDLRVSAPKVMYGANTLDSITLTANTGAEVLNYALTLEGAGTPTMRLNRTAIVGNVADNIISTDLKVQGAEQKTQYALGATINASDTTAIVISLKDRLLLDYDAWTVQPNNAVQIGAKGLVVQNFGISSDGQSLTANSESPVANSPIRVSFNAFRIKTITNIAGQDSTLADGLINGFAEVENFETSPIFRSDLNIADLSLFADTLGNLVVKVDNETANSLSANVSLSGKGNDLTLIGTYGIETKVVDMDLNLNSIDLQTIKAVSAGQISAADGFLKGQFSITGFDTAPKINGNMHFEDAYVTPTLLGSKFVLTNNPITVNGTGIHFDKFSLTDSAKNQAIIDGDVLTKDFKNFAFNLNVTADEFQVANSVKTANGNEQPFYGKLNVSTNTSVRGDMNLPIVKSKVSVNRNTDFWYILPTANPELQSREGVVKFVDMDHLKDTAIFQLKSDSVAKLASGIDLEATITTDSDAIFHVVIDESNGDAVNIQGVAELQAVIDQSGKISLTGTYVMNEGSYLLTLSALKRKFIVKPGSNIVWNGDPLSATVDLTAIYVANTAPIDLLQAQLSSQDVSEKNKYNEKLPFQVNLIMKGELMKPIISFDIELPDKVAGRWPDVATKLSQVRTDPSELNKQVFALLLLNRFVGENPLESSASNGPIAETFVRQSASRLLTDQLNKLAGNLIKGFELNFGVNSGSDYSTGEYATRTDLNVGLSKKLLNDRLRVNVGSNFQLEGPSNSNRQVSNLAGDVSIDYLLTSDNRYVLRAYRANEYQGVAAGQVIETGASLIFNMDYNKFKEVFRFRKKGEADDPRKKKKVKENN